MTHTTRYETREGKTYRADDAKPALPANPGAAETAAPKKDGADNHQMPGRPAKEGA
jgi:hypothetical protein